MGVAMQNQADPGTGTNWQRLRYQLAVVVIRQLWCPKHNQLPRHPGNRPLQPADAVLPGRHGPNNGQALRQIKSPDDRAVGGGEIGIGEFTRAQPIYRLPFPPFRLPLGLGGFPDIQENLLVAVVMTDTDHRLQAAQGTCRPVSSAISRASACCTVSPGSTLPPGNSKIGR